MDSQYLGLLTQIPLVGAFMWFVLEWSKRNATAQDERDRQMRSFILEQRENDRSYLRAVVDELRELHAENKDHDQRAAEHDRRMADAITRMEERTRPTPKRSKAKVEAEA